MSKRDTETEDSDDAACSLATLIPASEFLAVLLNGTARERRVSYFRNLHRKPQGPAEVVSEAHALPAAADVGIVADGGDTQSKQVD